MNRLVRILCALSLSIGTLAAAQAPGTGLYNFGSFDSRGFDSINLGNLNTHFEIPIVNKQGRGLSFNYSFVYDGLIWASNSSAGTGTWQPDSSWGFRGAVLGGNYTGYMISSFGTFHCSPAQGGMIGTRRNNYVYHDPYGMVHSFDYSVTDCSGTESDPVVSGDGTTTDSSGYYLGLSDGLIHSQTGKIINAPSVRGGLAFGSITDSNGNVVTNNGTGTFTDTLGTTALTIGGSGNASSPLTFAYPVTLQSDGASLATTTVSYRTYTVQTNFQCSGMIEYGATSVDLVDHVTLADGSTYTFTYETTPGVGTGAVTGRLASVTLPTGGSISYSYSGGCNGSGINGDGTVGTLTRTTSDGTRSYSRSVVNAAAASTTVQDEKGNQSVYQSSASGGFYYETHRQIHQGPTTGPILLDQSTCYNGVASGCDGVAITTPISQTTINSSFNGGSQLRTVNSYVSGTGLLQSSRQEDPANGNATLYVTSSSYNSFGEVTGTNASDGTTVIASSTFNYDETTPTATSGIPSHRVIAGGGGNMTSTQIQTGTGTINTSTTYYDTGVPIATTTPNGPTSYSYDATQTFVTTTALPTPSSGVPLSTSASYDQQSGAQTSATGLNSGQTTQYTQYDRLLRPTSLTLPNGSVVTISYSQSDTVVSQTIGNGGITQFHTLVDAYGRKSRTALSNGQSGNPWYQIDSCYDATGLLQFQTVRYQGNGWSTPKQCSGPGTSYLRRLGTYDQSNQR